jgi:hypothetical protein
MLLLVADPANFAQNRLRGVLSTTVWRELRSFLASVPLGGGGAGGCRWGSGLGVAELVAGRRLRDARVARLACDWSSMTFGMYVKI